MDRKKKKALEAKGYKVGSVDEFLGLSKEESEYIELKLALSQALAKRRKQRNLTQVQLAKILDSSQSRIAKMEKGDPTVTLDLLVKSLLGNQEKHRKDDCLIRLYLFVQAICQFTVTLSSFEQSTSRYRGISGRYQACRI
jgi:DNA-binding XRE family transcriptional regulator